MTTDKYHVLAGPEGRYEFLSEGPKGIIKKIVLYDRLSDNIYNLGFGDWNETEQKVDDTVRSNNNDSNKVLATVASTIIDFLEHRPDAAIIAQGVTAAKTRLYQMLINQHFQGISPIFNIEGSYKGHWEPFRSGKNYEAFMAKSQIRM